MAQFNGLVPLNEFKTIIGREELQFKKGKGRQFCSTPAGVLFMAKSIDIKKQLYVTQAAADFKSTEGTELGGSLWLVNAAVVDGDKL